MSQWFDGYARRSARSSTRGAVSNSGATRRQVLVGGALMTGAAWTAPALLSASPAWAVASCPGDAVRCGTDNHCCPATPTGTAKYTCPTKTNVCTAPGEVGGSCQNNGAGGAGCAANSVHCNNATPNICGGPGAQCAAGTDCASGVCALTTTNPIKLVCS